MGIRVQVGTSLSLDALKKFKEEELGNFVYFGLEEDVALSIKKMPWCRKEKVYLVIEEIRNRFSEDLEVKSHLKGYTKEVFEKIKKTTGNYLIARSTIAEPGALVYCLKGYFKKKSKLFKPLPVVKDMLSAKEVYMARIKKAISLEKKLSGKMSLFIIDASLFHSYHLEAGIDKVYLEVLPGNSNLMFSALRGASRTYQKKDFGAHIAMAWYGGAKWDDLWFKRWKTSLYFSYIAGADPIYSEGAVFGFKGLGNDYKDDNEKIKQYRKILREFYRFCQSHPRPEKGPKVKIAIIQGNLDGNAGLWNKQVWGQYKGRHWLHSSPEYGWDYFNCFFRKEEWFNNFHVGEKDFSGNPPYGQIDIIPANAPLKVLNNYSCIIFLGWNTMTKEIYEKLKNYVKKGGHLLMSIPHLSAGIRREKDLTLYNSGDYRDLFGVKIEGKGKTYNEGIKIVSDSSLSSYSFPNWTIGCDPKFSNGNIRVAKIKTFTAKIIARISFCFNWKGDKKEGPPILTENSLGKGKAFLLTSWDYPGSKGLKLLMQDIVRVINTGKQPEDIRLGGSDRVRYAVYQEDGLKTVYLLNTDPDLKQEVNLYLNNKVFPLQISPNEIRIAWLSKELAISPENKSLYVKEITDNIVKLEGIGKQKIDILSFKSKYQKINFKFSNRVIEYEVKDKLLVDLG